VDTTDGDIGGLLMDNKDESNIRLQTEVTTLKERLREALCEVRELRKIVDGHREDIQNAITSYRDQLTTQVREIDEAFRKIIVEHQECIRKEVSYILDSFNRDKENCGKLFVTQDQLKLTLKPFDDRLKRVENLMYGAVALILIAFMGMITKLVFYSGGKGP
jgi:hypothetical protein